MRAFVGLSQSRESNKQYYELIFIILKVNTKEIHQTLKILSNKT